MEVHDKETKAEVPEVTVDEAPLTPKAETVSDPIIILLGSANQPYLRPSSYPIQTVTQDSPLHHKVVPRACRWAVATSIKPFAVCAMADGALVLIVLLARFLLMVREQAGFLTNDYYDFCTTYILRSIYPVHMWYISYTLNVIHSSIFHISNNDFVAHYPVPPMLVLVQRRYFVAACNAIQEELEKPFNLSHRVRRMVCGNFRRTHIQRFSD